MKKIIFKNFLTETTQFFLLSSCAVTIIVWVIQAVNYLEFVTEDGHSFKVYFLYTIYSLPKIGQVYMLFLSKILNDDYAPMHETSEVKIYTFDEIPWDEIAFSSVTFALENYINDQKKGILGKCHSNFN